MFNPLMLTSNEFGWKDTKKNVNGSRSFQVSATWCLVSKLIAFSHFNLMLLSNLLYSTLVVGVLTYVIFGQSYELYDHIKYVRALRLTNHNNFP